MFRPLVTYWSVNDIYTERTYARIFYSLLVSFMKVPSSSSPLTSRSVLISGTGSYKRIDQMHVHSGFRKKFFIQRIEDLQCEGLTFNCYLGSVEKHPEKEIFCILLESLQSLCIPVTL